MGKLDEKEPEKPAEKFTKYGVRIGSFQTYTNGRCKVCREYGSRHTAEQREVCARMYWHL